MSSVPLSQLAFARSGDKGDSTNVGVVAKSQAAYDLLVRELTAERVQRHFAGISKGKVESRTCARSTSCSINRSKEGPPPACEPMPRARFTDRRYSS